MTRSNRNPRAWIAPVLWIGTGFLIFFVVFFDPLHLHPLDSLLRARLGYREAAEAAAGSAAEIENELWTCPMHPHILEENPGECPICGMNLVRAKGQSTAGRAAGSSTARSKGEILFYRNPMNPTITSPVPAKDEMGMDYVPVYADEAVRAIGPGTEVSIDPATVQNMNVQSVLVERRDLTHEIRTVGYLEYDQERMVTVTTKYTGWVEKVYVNYVGEPVRRGQPLFEIYAPELLQTEQELLSAIEYAKKFVGTADDALRRAEALVDAARTRLSYWDIAPEQISRLEETGEIFRTLKVVAPSSGLVMKRMPGLEGMAVKPGMETYHIANLSSLWLSVEIFEDQVAWIRERSPADVTFTYFPGETFRGTVRFLEPEFSEKTRTLRVKLEVPNPDRKLRAGMFATVTFEPVAARAVLTVPSLAVLRTGQRDVVVVDLGEGRFAPRTVNLGHEGVEFVEVLEGLEEGERVVTSAQFLIDSEANLQEAIQKMMAQRQEMAPSSEGAGHAR
ncbi:MAG: efflux RND transporter periplasmic adaptor subunit [bacterium]|nr:efflux RND transporter periplasmic adaptor subunit [bacterium]